MLATALRAEPPAPSREATRRVGDFNVGETQHITLANGKQVSVRLVDVAVTHDRLRQAVRSARVTVEIDGTRTALGCGNYHLPQTVAGVQIDCTVVKAYNANTNLDHWGLEKDARLRLWPANSPLIEPGTFQFPLKQKWFATSTQMANEPTYVNGGEEPNGKSIYYHNDLDFGGCEGLVDVVAATDGLVVSVAGKTLSGYEGTPARPRYDVVYLLDDRGWYYRYSHLHTIDGAVQLGAKLTRGQKVGILGKEGASGGWSHLHFGIVSRQPSGKWGTEEAYAYAWEAYRNEYKPKLVAVARPHHFAVVGDKVVLDGSKSWSESGRIALYAWSTSSGGNTSGPTCERTYARPGTYSEILKVADPAGNVAYDFAIVQVADLARPTELPPTIHASYAPSLGIKVGQPVTFKVRTFRTTAGSETWDFGDGTERVTVKSDGAVKALAKDGYAITTHAFARSGTFLVRVERKNERGEIAMTHLAVDVGR